MSRRILVGFTALTILVLTLIACGSETEIAEVTRAVAEVKATTVVKETLGEKETVVETMGIVPTTVPAATPTPFIPTFVVEGGAGDAGAPDAIAAIGSEKNKRIEAQPTEPLTAGEIDDNERFAQYLAYVQGYYGPPVFGMDVSERHIISLRDSQGLPVLDAHVTAFADGQIVFEGRTTAAGQVLVHPRALGLSGAASVAVRVEKGGVVNEVSFVGGRSDHHIVKLDLPRLAGWPVALDVLFLIDATGSMEDEINKLKASILHISAQIDALPARPDVRFAMVTYRDRGDVYVTHVNQFTPDVRAFQAELNKVRAGGGGDYPESLNEALHRAIWDVTWRESEAVRLIFLVADAPPHLDYEQDFAYDEEMVKAVRQGIKIIPIASSGLDDQGEYIFRQLAQFTLGRFVFLTYQEAGQPGSGPGTETDHHVEPQEYTVDLLDSLIVRLVEEELAALDDQTIQYQQQ